MTVTPLKPHYILGGSDSIQGAFETDLIVQTTARCLKAVNAPVYWNLISSLWQQPPLGLYLS